MQVKTSVSAYCLPYICEESMRSAYLPLTHWSTSQVWNFRSLLYRPSRKLRHLRGCRLWSLTANGTSPEDGGYEYYQYGGGDSDEAEENCQGGEDDNVEHDEPV